jgi:hypothetical protein
MNRRFALAAACLSILSAACSPRGGRFVTANARAHVNMLAETIGARPAGSDANRRAREYLIDQLQIAGMAVRVQDTEARRADTGVAGRVSNIVAIRQGSDGTTSDAIALVAHYDSIPDGPGAGDDAFGAAIAVEAARVLGAAPMRHSLMVLLTDSEESGLLGAAGAMADPTIRDRIAAYMNIEATGTSGPAFLFETGPGNRWLTSAWARYAPFPRGASFAAEVYKRTPNDTDFTMLRRADVPGLNFAIIGDSTAYHTDRDTAARVDDRSLTTMGDNAIAIATGLDALNLRRRALDDATYFDVAGTWALSYGPMTALIIGVLSIALGVLAWLRSTASTVRATGILRLLLLLVWSVAGAVAVVAAMAGALWLLRAVREVYHPWYGQMGRTAAFMVAAGIAAGWLVSRAGALIPARARGDRHPAAAWAVALPFWIAIAGALMWFAPGAAQLATVPLLSAGVLLLATPLRSSTAVRITSAIVLAIAAAVWIRNALDLLFYANALFGRFATITPLWIFPALLAVAGLFVVPPFLSTVSAGSPLARPSVFTGFCLIAVAVTGLAAYSGSAYTDRDPLRRHARFVQDDGSKTAMWEIGGNEPGLDVVPADGLTWAADAGTGPRPLRLSTPLPYPFLFTAPAPIVATPAVATASVTTIGDGVEMTITVRPRDPSAFVTLALPAGVTPARANLPGVVTRANRWRSIFAAPPAEGVLWRVVVSGSDASRLGESGIVVESAFEPGAPDGSTRPMLPAWMPREATAWRMRSVYLIPVGPLLPPPALIGGVQ